MTAKLQQKLYCFAALMLAILLLFGCVTGSPYTEAGHIEILVFGIGRADAILITTENHAMLIDTGSREHGSLIVECLQDRDIDKLDYLIITHFDSDHVGGAYILISEIAIKNVIVPNYDRDSNHMHRFRNAMTDAELHANVLTETINFTLDDTGFMVNPSLLEFEYFTRNDNDPAEWDDENEITTETSEKPTGNDYSLVVSMTHGENSFLFTGDAVAGRLQELLENDEIKKTGYDFLKVPRHGRYNENITRFIQFVNPRYAVITGFHPDLAAKYYPERPADERVIKTFEDVGAEIYFAMDTSVRIISDGTHMVIEH